ncbi:MAG: uncharacterized protein JWN75_21 [Candidatus Saccharibacteria bacterium]|nr:uncharacterized protein [Candidatus Saccharibacteria bacterium]
MKLVVVYNPKSGSAQTKKQLKRLFKAANITIESFIVIDDKLSRHLQPFCRKGKIIAAIGGDGTIASVAAIVHTSQALFAPLPGGTLNHFTKDADIDQDLEIAIKNLTNAKQRKIDVATVNKKLFLNNSSIGIYPTTLQTRKRFEDKLGKWPSAVVSTIRAFVRFRIYTITINGKIYRTPFVFVGNNQYDIDNGGARKTLTSKKLFVYIIKSDKRRTLIRLLFASIIGQARSDNDLITLSTQKIIIHSHKNRLNVSTDGELVSTSTPITYESLPGSLTILS